MTITGSIDFLTPAAAFVSLAALLPLAAALRGADRVRRARSALGLAPPSRSVDVVAYVALAAVVCCLGLAAAQPVLTRDSALSVRSDAQVLFVVDVSRSMAAATGPTAPTRLERAREAARRLRAAIPEVEAGVATLTDRVLPNLLPVADATSFDRTLAQSVRIEEPPPRETAVRATNFAALTDVPEGNYFGPDAKRRVLVLLTDGETRPIDDSQVARALAAGEGISLLAVRFWKAREAIRDPTGELETAYRPDATGAVALESLASASGGKAFDEPEFDAARSYLREALGEGPTRPTVVRRRDDIPLGPFVAALALVPLGVLLLRRERMAASLVRLRRSRMIPAR